jgi:carboxymethylenebutenolidase
MTIPPVMDDVAAMIAFADSQPASKKGPVGTHGYCMSGPYSLAAAARFPTASPPPHRSTEHGW